MRIAIIGGGLAGLTAALDLAKKNHHVVVFEKEKTLGGLSCGFRAPAWSWSLEKTYHHLFANDKDILDAAQETGFKDVFFQEPETASLYGVDNYRTIPVDTPQDFLKFPLLTWPQKIRSGIVIAALKSSPFFSYYEKITAECFLRKTMGDIGWKVLWQELFRKKFGKYAGNILTSFIWARIKKRTKKLGYISGGFQSFIDHLEDRNKKRGVIFWKGKGVDSIQTKKRGFVINSEFFDSVISTVATPIFASIGKDILPRNYLSQLSKISYLHATNLILETKKPLLNKTYWLNICVDKFPMVAFVQHTNFIDKKYYNNNQILYIANYVDGKDKLLKMTKEETLKHYLPYLQKISNIKDQISNIYLYTFPYAQPVYDKIFIKNRPNYETPVKNLYVANLDMTYPYDRGTNYAIKIGREVARMM